MWFKKLFRGKEKYEYSKNSNSKNEEVKRKNELKEDNRGLIKSKRNFVKNPKVETENVYRKEDRSGINDVYRYADLLSSKTTEFKIDYANLVTDEIIYTILNKDVEEFERVKNRIGGSDNKKLTMKKPKISNSKLVKEVVKDVPDGVVRRVQSVSGEFIDESGNIVYGKLKKLNEVGTDNIDDKSINNFLDKIFNRALKMDFANLDAGVQLNEIYNLTGKGGGSPTLIFTMDKPLFEALEIMENFMGDCPTSFLNEVSNDLKTQIEMDYKLNKEKTKKLDNNNYITSKNFQID